MQTDIRNKQEITRLQNNKDKLENQLAKWLKFSICHCMNFLSCTVAGSSSMIIITNMIYFRPSSFDKGFSYFTVIYLLIKTQSCYSGREQNHCHGF